MHDHSRRVSRRNLLQHGAVAFGGIFMAPFAPALAGAARREPTPEQIVGPFYPVLKPLDRDGDLTVIKGKRSRARGEVIHVAGRVLNARGTPVAGVRIEVWQANAHGRYAHPADINPAPLDPNFQGYAVQLTDRLGRYRFKTIKPGAYPVNPINPAEERPPHIHFDVTGRKDRLVTQMYFRGDPRNERDILFRELGGSQQAVVATLAAPVEDVEADAKLFTWDIVLATG